MRVTLTHPLRFYSSSQVTSEIDTPQTAPRTLPVSSATNRTAPLLPQYWGRRAHTSPTSPVATPHLAAMARPVYLDWNHTPCFQCLHRDRHTTGHTPRFQCLHHTDNHTPHFQCPGQQTHSHHRIPALPQTRDEQLRSVPSSRPPPLNVDIIRTTQTTPRNEFLNVL